MASNKLILLAIVACVAVQQTTAFQISDCAASKKPDAQLKSVEINTCPDATGDRCDFVKGKNATLTIQLEPTAAFTQANIKIFGKIGPVWIPFRFDGPTDACGNYGLQCPVKVGDKEEMKMSLPVLRVYPSIKTTVRFELNDQVGQPIVCFEFPVQIKNN